MTTVYTDADTIAALLSRTLTSEQQFSADEAADAASNFIEEALGRSWLDAGAGVLVEDERHIIEACRLWLKHPPVTDDDTLTISARLRIPGATAYTLTPPTQYELIDPAFGHVYLSPTVEGQLATVSYTSSETIPPLIVEFATQLAAGMLMLSINGSGSSAATAGVKSYTLWGGDLRVEYADSAIGTDGSSTISSRLPALWSDIERLYCRKPSVV